MRFIFIICIIFTFLSLIYLAYFFYLKHFSNLVKLHKDKKNLKVITCILLPVLSFIIIAFDFIYLILIYKSIIPILFLTIVLVPIYIGFSNCFYDILTCTYILLILAGILGFFILFGINDITLEEKEVTNTVKLYDNEIIDDDLSAIIISLKFSLFDNSKPYAIMQHYQNDLNDNEFNNSFTCSKFKFVDKNDDKLEITHTEITKCNLFYYHGFTNLKTKTEILEDSYETILYINPENIVYQ